MKFKGLNIHGLGFRQDSDSFFDIPNWEMMWNINKEENNLIIFHFPYYGNELQNFGFNIQLSGHSHGCQFYPAIFFAKLIFPYNKGLFENEGNYLNVSEGVGTMGPPIRIGTNSSITLLKLRKNRIIFELSYQRSLLHQQVH